MKTQIFAVVFLVLRIGSAVGQTLQDSVDQKPFKANVGLAAIGTSNGQVPFWMRANRYGSIPLDGASAAIIVDLRKDYDHSRKKLVDWGAGFDGRLNLGRTAQFIPIEAYVKGRLGIFQLKAGRSRDISGLVDSTLSVGSFAVSGNALGVPKIELSVPEFWSIPFTGNIFALKGFFSFGSMGKVPIQYGANNGADVKSFLHSKSIHFRFGKPNWTVKLYTGINHQVIWGSDKYIFGDQYNLSGFGTLWHVISGKKYVQHGLQQDISKVGNHLGAVDLGLQLDFPDISILAYRQQFYEKGALYYLANIKDGLAGVSIKNMKRSDRTFQWDKFLLEWFYSKHQAGEADTKKTPSGAEYYYNHAIYKDGYSYRGLGLGTPLITAASVMRSNLPNDPSNFFSNTRVIAFNLGAQGSVSSFNFLLKLTYSKNYGEYRTSDIPYWFNGRRYQRVPKFGIFPEVNQFSGYLEINKALKRGFRVNLGLALDHGDLLYNSMGAEFKVIKSW
ncbi:hypothetical protein GCM10007423_64340 [Dyadobacter endophyticus]|uniref:Capsule assembly protein Wzi n=1 Tax=Dyadobacter endophyticus TaxID=1749036 RepID=A0ABQ1ZDZ4_9BACT|nr:capsule assembly Wzi family protein [Dyadobacter endophyticus]GGH56105.1 hypothetical protein GCM10007423_64340 [Dyadobacter endophyticus]